MNVSSYDKETVLSDFKISTKEETFEFEVISNALRTSLDSRLKENSDRIEDLDNEIARLTNHTDSIDNWLAIGSGVICGLVDIFYVGDLSLDLDNGANYNDRAAVSKLINKFIQRVAEHEGYTGERLSGAIGKLEQIAPVDQDNIWKGLGISSTKLHHLEDLAHHPTPLGFVCALLVSFLGIAVFVDREGSIHFIKVPKSKEELFNTLLPILISGVLYWLACIGARKFTDKELSEQPKWARSLIKLIASAPVLATITRIARNWALHLASDAAGSKGTAGGGMGIPGLFISFLKELAIFPPFSTIGLNQKVSEIYSKNRFDLRSELLPMLKGLGSQAIPVLMNECIVSSFYFVRQLINEYKINDGWHGIDWIKVIPYGNRSIVRMRTISSGVFTAIDMADAAIRSYMKSGGEPINFILNMALRVNFVGVGRFVISIGNDVAMGMRKSKMKKIRAQAMIERLYLLQAKLYIKQNDTWIAIEQSSEAVKQLEEISKQSLEQLRILWQEIENDLTTINETISNDSQMKSEINKIL